MTEQQLKEMVASQVALEIAKIRRRSLIFRVLCIVFVPLTLWGASITIPNQFTDGDILSASKLNQNFQTLLTKVNELDTTLNAKSLGSWQVLAANTNYLAATDGFVVTYATYSYFDVKSDGSNPPTTQRIVADGNTANASFDQATVPVRKGDYWRVSQIGGGVPTVFWIPLGN